MAEELIIDKKFFKDRKDKFDKDFNKEKDILNELNNVENRIKVRRFNINTNDIIEIYDIQDDIAELKIEINTILGKSLEYEKNAELLLASFEIAIDKIKAQWLMSDYVKNSGLKNKEEKYALIDKGIFESLELDIYYFLMYAKSQNIKATTTSKQVNKHVSVLKGLEEQLSRKITILQIQKDIGALKSDTIYNIGRK